MKRITRHITFAFALGCSLAASAASYIDGLHFMKSPDLVIERQDVQLSLDQITLSYLLNNISSNDITETLVFSSPMQNQFALMVNDEPVTYSILHRAISNNGTDISNTLKGMGLAFDPITAMHILDASPNRDSLRKKLAALGLIDLKDETPKWTTKTYYYWQQKFPAKASVRIRHSYKPSITIKNMKVKSVSEFLKMPITFAKKIFFQDESAVLILKTQLEKHHPDIAEFCPTNSDYLQIIGNNKFENKSRIIVGKELNYHSQQDDMLLTPVNHFSLTIDAPENMHPILCWNDTLRRKTSNTIFFETDNYVPIKNISVLFVQRLGEASGVKPETGN